VSGRDRIPAQMTEAERAAAEEAERFEQQHPDDAVRRREFLARTAAVAGAAGLAATLPGETLIGEAARVQSRASKLPSPRNMPIDTFVVLMMENRSFDHYFGWHPDADAKNAGLSYPDQDGNPVSTHRLTPDWQGCAFRDPNHSWDGGRHQYGAGQMNGFVQGNAAGTGSDSYAAGYYEKEDLGFISHAAEEFQLHDRFFCSLMASTYPNRHYMWSAQSGGQKNNQFMINEWETIFDRATSKGRTATYFNSDIPFSALYGPRGLGWTESITNYYTRAAQGKLSNINFVDPSFGGAGDGLSGDEHPHGDIRIGQAFMSDVVHAFMASPQWRRGALFIVYDEWGGFFDHVPPRVVPDDRSSTDLFENYGFTGFRIPAVVVSPFVRRGNISHATCMFESVLKLISHKFGLGYLNKRHRYAYNIGRSFDWNNPDFERPNLPDPATVAERSCSSQGFRSADAPAREKEHDLMELETSGFLDRLGYEYKPPTHERLFSDPDKVRQALEQQ
jgi:phospholipase C